MGPASAADKRIETEMNTRVKLQWTVMGFFLALVMILGCKREPTSWQIDVALPVLDDVVIWSDLLQETFEESEVTIEPGTPAVIAFHGPIVEWDIASLTQLPDTTVQEVLTPEFVGGPFPVPPGAVLLDSEEDIVFQGIEQAFTEIILESGQIVYSVESSTNGYVDLNYIFPSVTIADQAVELKVILPPSDGVAFQTEEGIIDLSGARIDLTGISGNEVNRIASQLIIGTPPDIADTAQVYGSDSIRVTMHFQDLMVQQVAGYFGQESVDFEVNQQLSDSMNLPTGFLEINPSRATLEFHNTIAADLRLQLNSMLIDGVSLNHPEFGMPQLVGRADWSSGEVEPSIWQMDLLDTSPALFDLLSYFPSEVGVDGEGLLNPLGDVSGGNDYFDTRVPPALYLDFEWPLTGAVEQFKLIRTLDFEGTDLPGFEGDLIIRLTNGFPVEWDFVGVWTYEEFDLEPDSFQGSLQAFPGSEIMEIRIPVDDLRAASAGSLTIEASMNSEGPVSFTGMERMRIQVAFEGSYDVVVQ